MATKKYFVFSDQIKATPEADGTDAFSTGGAYIELGKKLNKTGYASADKGKVATVKEISTDVYELALETPAAQTNSNWGETDASKVSYIQNKPFEAIGAGLSVVDVTESGVTVKKLQADTQLHFQIFAALPTAAAEYAQVIALVKKSPTSTEYYEHACVNVGTTESPSWKWEQIGAVDLQIEQSAAAITINGTTIQTASDSQIGLMSSADHQDMQVKSNKVSTIAATGSASDDKYPSEKATATALDTKQDANKLVTAWQSSVSDTYYPSEKLVKTSLDAKIPYASGSTSTAFTVGKDSTGYYLEE